MRLALVHDWLNQIGGAEDVLAELVRLYPGAPIYTSLYWRDGMPAAWRDWPIRTLWTDRLPGIYRHHQPYLPLYPLAFGALNISDYEVVLSNKSGFCHGFRKGADTLHICYCLAPTRYVWQFDAYVRREKIGGAVQLALSPLIRLLQRWDYAAAQRVDQLSPSQLRFRVGSNVIITAAPWLSTRRLMQPDGSRPPIPLRIIISSSHD
jgi:hypothetical protein